MAITLSIPPLTLGLSLICNYCGADTAIQSDTSIMIYLGTVYSSALKDLNYTLYCNEQCIMDCLFQQLECEFITDSEYMIVIGEGLWTWKKVLPNGRWFWEQVA